MDLISLIVGIFVGAALGEGTRRMLNAWRQRATDRVKKTIKDFRED